MKITTHLVLPPLLLLAACPGSDAVSPGEGGSSDSEAGITLGEPGASSGTSGTSSSTSSGMSSGNASLDDTAGTSGTSGPEPTVPRATVIMQTSGGGRVSSPSFAARIRIGAPQPVGHSASALHHAHLGPGSVQ